jgi:hypothetical protein
MSLEGILVGVIAIAIGLAWAFYGLKVFVVLLPVWAFLIGFVAGAQWGASLFNEGFLTTVLGWGIGLVFGLFLAAISFFWYYAAIVLLGGAVGYMLGVGFFEWLGWGTGFIAFAVGLLLGAVFAIGTFMLGVPALLVIVLSAFSGAAAAVNGVYILLGQIKLDAVKEGIFGSLLRVGVVPTVLFLAIGIAATLYQLRGVEAMAAARIDRTGYRY